ncbi:MFS transporter [Rhizobium sp. RCAM05973]|uniref:MFS transporter n=1 Tax=Rhizobium sp. RCAM05973 TaxID=2994066 RepID=UPI0022EBA786|nr:MFS transporter [Rhizobium sp. RCAM05973]
MAGGTLLIAGFIALFVRNGPANIGIAGFLWETEKAKAATASLAGIFKSRWIYVGGFGISACTMAIAGTATWVIPAYITVHSMPIADAALIGTLMGISQVFFLVVGGYAADHLGKALMIKIGAALALLVAISFTVGTAQPISFTWMILLALFSGVALFGGGAIFSLLSEKYPDELATAAVGFAEIFGILSTFISPWVMGVVIHTTGGSFSSAFLAFAIAEAVLLVVIVAMARESAAVASNSVVGSASRS